MSVPRLCRFPSRADNVPGLNRAGLFNQVNQGKRSVALDLSNPAAIEVAHRMVQWADVVVENFLPGVIARMGLGYEALRALRPDLIMLSISDYGQTGPYRQYASYGGIIGAHSGFYAYNGHAGDEPRDLGATYADPAGGSVAAAAIVQALVNRALTGQGQYIDMSMLEALETLAAEGILELTMNGREPRRLGNRDPFVAPHNCYKARGDAEMWVSIVAGNENEWRALCAAIGQPSLAGDPRFATAALRKRNEDELDRIITQWTRPTTTAGKHTAILQRAGVAVFPTLGNQELAEEPHLLERGFIVEHDHPEAGRRKHSGICWSMSGTRGRALARAPLLGEHTLRGRCKNQCSATRLPPTEDRAPSNG